MNKLARKCLISILMLTPWAVFALPHPVAVESSIEASKINVMMDQTGKGILLVTPCPGCLTQSFVITPNITVIQQGHAVSYEALRTRDGQPATVLFNLKNRQLTRIIW